MFLRRMGIAMAAGIIALADGINKVRGIERKEVVVHRGWYDSARAVLLEKMLLPEHGVVGVGVCEILLHYEGALILVERIPVNNMEYNAIDRVCAKIAGALQSHPAKDCGYTIKMLLVGHSRSFTFVAITSIAKLKLTSPLDANHILYELSYDCVDDPKWVAEVKPKVFLN